MSDWRTKKPESRLYQEEHSSRRSSAPIYPSEHKKQGAPNPRPPENKQPQKTKNTRKKKKRGILLRMLMFLVIIGLLITITLLQTCKRETGILRGYIGAGTIENTASGNAYFLRKEQVLTAARSGKLVAGLNEGDRVAAGSVIAYIVSPEQENTLIELQKVENKLYSVQKNNDKSITLLSEEISHIDSEIRAAAEKMVFSSRNGSLLQYGVLVEELRDLADKKNDIILNANTENQYIQSLKDQRDSLKTQLTSYMQEIKAPAAGIISYYTDGAEVSSAELTENCEKATRYNQLITTSGLSAFETKSSRSVGKDVKEGDAVIRFTSEISYYIPVMLNSEVKNIYADQEITLKSSDRRFSAKATVVSVFSDGEKQIVLCKSNFALASSFAYRKMSLDIVVSYTEGMKVPLRALSGWDKAHVTAQIAILRSNYIEFVYVNVLDQNDKYAIISAQNSFAEDGTASVKLNDIYIVNPEKVTEGQILQ